MGINNIIRQIDEANAKINLLERDIDKLVDYIKDKFPLRRGDRFEYCDEYCGTMMFLDVCQSTDSKAYIVVEYKKDNGDYDAIYQVDCNRIKKIETKTE